VSIVSLVPKKEVLKGFRIDYIDSTMEVIKADSFGITESMGDYITFYNESEPEEEMLIMIKSSLIKKIELVEIKDERA
jgi:hypothetical protein